MRVKLFISLVILSINLLAQDATFFSINTSNGISSNHITSVLEDKLGFLWFTTSEGLNRWDGYNAKVFKNIPYDNFSIADNFSLCMAEDNKGNIWIGTNQNGVSRYNISEERFYNYESASEDKTTLPSTVIRTIFIDNKENIWVGTNNGLAKYIDSLDHYKHFTFTVDNEEYQTHIRNIFHINNDELLVENNLGIFRLNINSEKITQIDYPINITNEPFGNSYPLLLDSKGNFWIGSVDGLIKYNPAKNRTKIYTHNDNDNRSISSHNISVLFEDSKQNIWIGTKNNGVNLYDENADDFKVYKADPIKKNSLCNNIITDIYEDKKGNLWIASQEGGISYIANTIKKYEHFTFSSFNTNTIGDNKVGAFCEDNDGSIWIGTGKGGLSVYNEHTSDITRTKIKNDFISPSILGIKNNPNKSNSIYVTGWEVGLFEVNTNTFKQTNIFKTPINSPIPTNKIKGMGIDSNNNIWLATHQNEGVEVYDPNTKTFFNKFNSSLYNSDLLAARYPVSMFEDSKKRHWIVSYTGLYLYDSTYHYFRTLKNDSTTISSNYCYTLFEDSEQNIWIGSSNGLDKLIETDSNLYFERMSIKYNIPLNIKGILEDNNGNLWLSSTREITTFNPKTNVVRKIIGKNEIENQAFFERSCLKSQTGNMYFGGTHGFIKFNPDTLLNVTLNPNLQIVDFLIFNKSQGKNTENSVLTKSILETDFIELSYNQSDISFEFAAIEFNPYQKYEYAYILDGFDKTWNFVGEKRFATYTNLPHGNYTFRIKAVANGEIINYKGKSIQIRINPPFWKTSLAYVVYILLLIVAIYLFRMSILNREKLRNKLKVEQLEVINIQEANLMKLRFFTNISHEFKTPLTLIKAPIEKILSTTDRKENEEHYFQLDLIQRNADKLLKMVNQLMDYRKLEAGSLMLETSQGDIVEFCRSTWEVFYTLTTQRNITYEFKSSIKKQLMNFDSDKLDKIISNLITNSIKHTDEYGTITVSIKKQTFNKEDSTAPNHDEIEISVKDTGSGIPKAEIPYIFDRFYRASKTNNSHIEGTGIGLTLVKELTELHQGSIEVNSILGKGSEFIVRIPTELLIESDTNTTKTIIEADNDIKQDIIEQQIKNKIEDKQQDEKRYKVLIIEDDPDLRAFIRNELLNQYEVITANDGEDGQRKTFFNFPDIIISDVMMPNMDGIELCKSIKSDERTSHIPIILLTARTSEEKHIEGFEAGADDYIYKPFNLAVLKSRISNLLQHRTELIEKFKKDSSFDFESEGIDKKDKELIQGIIDIVLENINEDKINAEFITSRIHISRSLLYIKVEAITGQSVNEFIRGIRLKKSLRLLKQNTMSITEIAYAVGFSSQPYYTRCFTNLYGNSPSEYYNKNYK